MTTTKRRNEWGVQMCDGEIYQGHRTKAEALSTRTDIRASIRSGEVEADDYEPMTIVRRTVTTITTDWEETR